VEALRVDLDCDPDVRVHSLTLNSNTYFPDHNGLVRYSGHVGSLRVWLANPTNTAHSCLWRVDLWGKPNDKEWLLTGEISYRGGYRYQELVRTDTKSAIKYFALRVPGDCRSGLAITEPGTLTEGQLDAAGSTQEADVWSVRGGQGAHVAAIVVSLRGPTDLACDIPVYKSL